MKKKILAGIVNGLLVLSILSGCQKKEAAEAIDTTTATEEITASEEAQENTASEEAQILSVESLSAEQQNMLAVMDSLNMCMLENDWEYAPEDPAFLWTALFYTIGNHQKGAANGCAFIVILLHCFVEGSGDNICLLFRCQLNEIYRIS